MHVAEKWYKLCIFYSRFKFVRNYKPCFFFLLSSLNTTWKLPQGHQYIGIWQEKFCMHEPRKAGQLLVHRHLCAHPKMSFLCAGEWQKGILSLPNAALAIVCRWQYWFQPTPAPHTGTSVQVMWCGMPQRSFSGSLIWNTFLKVQGERTKAKHVYYNYE